MFYFLHLSRLPYIDVVKIFLNNFFAYKIEVTRIISIIKITF